MSVEAKEAIKKKYASYLQDPYNIPEDVGQQIKAEVLAILGVGMNHAPLDPRLVQQKLGITIGTPMAKELPPHGTGPTNPNEPDKPWGLGEDIVAGTGHCAHMIWSAILPHLVQGGCGGACTQKKGCKKWWCGCMGGWDGSGPLVRPGGDDVPNIIGLQEGVISRLQKLANIKKK